MKGGEGADNASVCNNTSPFNEEGATGIALTAGYNSVCVTCMYACVYVCLYACVRVYACMYVC